MSQFGQHRLDQRIRGRLEAFEDLSIGKSVLQALEVQAGTVVAKGSGTFVFVVENRSRKKVDKLRNVAVGDVVPELVGMLSPGSCPKIFQVTSWDRRNGVFSVPLDKRFLQRFPNLVLGRKDLVLERSSRDGGQW